MSPIGQDRYRSLTDFYLADVRRAVSREFEFGIWWRDGAKGPIHRAAWVRETKELYVHCLGPARDGTGHVQVLGLVRDRAELERMLRGWREACRQPDSLDWLRHRAAEFASIPANA